MTPNQLLELMTYETKDELKNAQKYIKLKGVVQYNRVIDYCKQNSIESTYKTVSSLYRYDKRLRDNLYRYIGTVEEYIRAIIGNVYEDKYAELFKTDKFEKKYSKFYSVSLTLENLTFGDLIDIALNNRFLFENIYDLENLKNNFTALRVLRNKVSHHNFLLTENYENCVIKNFTDNSLKFNIENLRYFLPKEFQSRFIEVINKCTLGLSLPINFILIIGDVI